MSSRDSIAARAVLALALMIGFYLLAAAVSFGLFYIPYAEWTFAHRIHPKLALVCVFSGAAIIWSVLPRVDKFAAPGPRLLPEQQVSLFREIRAIAKATGQQAPSEVYIVPDVNAWVSERGGIMGFGGRRVMGLGLPLMRVLTHSQLRAVLAHEFGHFCGGDTKLGPWIYKTRSAIGRTLESLGNQRSIVQMPFLWYGNMFLRATHGVSRRQEFLADEMAARAVGSGPLIDGLRAVHGVGPAFPAYWENEVAPVLHAGFRPPLAEGFAKFIRAGNVAEAITKHVDEELKSGEVNPYDTHPPLKDRINALAAISAGQSPERDDAPAISLLENVASLESQLLASMAGAEAASKLKALDWNEVCAQVFMPQWAKLVKANAARLSSLNAEDLPAQAAQAKNFSEGFVNVSGEKAEADEATHLTSAVIGAALILLIAAKGGTVGAQPGDSVSVSLNSKRMEPFGIFQSLAAGTLSGDAWIRQCTEFEIQGMSLVPPDLEQK